jgi:hypothetical protein
MSESNTDTTTEADETGQVTETETAQNVDQLPADHPLVKTLAAQKTEIKDLKAKAKRLDEIEESQKTEAEKAAERITKAEAEAASVPAKVSAALKEHLVALHQFDAEDAELFLTADDPDLLLKQVSRLLDRSDKRRKKNIVAREGENPSAASSDEATFARDLFGSG